MVAQTRSKSRSSAKIGVNVNRVPETSDKKTMKKARSKVNVADASQKARSKEVVNHNVAEASKKEKKIKEKEEVAEDVDSEADTYPGDSDSDDSIFDCGGPYMKSVDYAFSIFLKDYINKRSWVNPISMEQVTKAGDCYDALSPKEREIYVEKYKKLEDANFKRLEAKMKELHGEHYQLRRFRTLDLSNIGEYI